jgi:hypothetical protein
MFQLATITILTHYRQLFGSCGAHKTCVFRLVAKISDQFSEQRINIKFCVKLGKNPSDTCEMLSEVCGGNFKKVKCNGSQMALMSKSQMKSMVITFFDIKGTVHFEFTPQDQTFNQAYYVEVF